MMSQLTDEDIQGTKDASSRLTGCDLSHLSLAEAHLIQAVRDLNLDPEILMQELKQR